MRRYILIAMLVLIALPSEAKKEFRDSPYRYEVDITWGGYPTFAWGAVEQGSSTALYGNGLEYAYSDFISRRVMTGLISADFNIQFRKGFALGTQFNVMAITNSLKTPQAGKVTDKFNDYSLSLIPYARFTYLNRLYVKMYLSFGLGIGLHHDTYAENRSIVSDNYLTPCFQFVPLGLTVGKRIYGIGEIGVGTEYCGFRVGIGYRF